MFKAVLRTIFERFIFYFDMLSRPDPIFISKLSKMFPELPGIPTYRQKQNGGLRSNPIFSNRRSQTIVYDGLYLFKHISRTDLLLLRNTGNKLPVPPAPDLPPFANLVSKKHRPIMAPHIM